MQEARRDEFRQKALVISVIFQKNRLTQDALICGSHEGMMGPPSPGLHTASRASNSEYLSGSMNVMHCCPGTSPNKSHTCHALNADGDPNSERVLTVIPIVKASR